MQYPLNISELALFVAGLALLSGGAEMVVRGALRLAASLGIEPLMLGLTVVAIGTSTPELVIGITASWQGSGALAVGNIAGTNMVNILLILGLSALLRPLPLHLRVLKLDLPAMITAAAMMTVMAWDGLLTRLDGGVLFGAAILYTVVLIRVGRGETQAVKAEFRDMYSDDIKARSAVAQTRVRYIVLLAAGMGLTVLGADWLVSGAVGIARSLGISEAVIGLTIVAIGTSAPELATTIVATIKGERDVAIGNLLGSSIYNIFVILGLTCLVSPGGVPVERQLLFVDIPLMAGVALLCIPVFVTGKCVSRWEGGAFIAFYVIYMLSLIFSRS
jgi:cation:H+ antiporter